MVGLVHASDVVNSIGLLSTSNIPTNLCRFATKHEGSICSARLTNKEGAFEVCKAHLHTLLRLQEASRSCAA